ncbi:MAG: hypothetical protein LBH81_00925 [Rickettsiales bacterium]|nr:hypothetical protein [Rickettsiales bacterium]
MNLKLVSFLGIIAVLGMGCSSSEKPVAEQPAEEEAAECPAVPRDLVINLDIEIEDDEDGEWEPVAAGPLRAGRLGAFDDALAEMMAGHPAPTFPNPFTHVQNNYLFENKVVVIGDLESYGKLHCGGPVGRGRCPHGTQKECAVWNKKPPVRATTQIRGHGVDQRQMCIIITELKNRRSLPVGSESGRVLIGAHRNLLTAGKKCCTNSLGNALRDMGASQLDVRAVMSDDENVFHFTDRCLVMSDEEIQTISGGGQLAAAMTTAQQTCFSGASGINFKKMLTPFMQLFNTAPELRQLPLDYDYTAPNGNTTRVSITHDVLTLAPRL